MAGTQKKTRAAADEEPSAELIDELRTWFYQRLLADREWWYELMKGHAAFGSRETESGAKMTMKIVDKLLSDQRHYDPGLRSRQGPTPRPVNLRVLTTGNVTIDRGTKKARELAEKKRLPAPLETAGEVVVDGEAGQAEETGAGAE